MKQEYYDITSKLGPPIWWDEAGCPRYEPFNPGMANDFYAREVALLRVSCQWCQADYLVCVSAGVQDPRPFQERPQLLAYGVGSSRVDLQACKLEYSIVSPK